MLNLIFKGMYNQDCHYGFFREATKEETEFINGPDPFIVICENPRCPEKTCKYNYFTGGGILDIECPYFLKNTRRPKIMAVVDKQSSPFSLGLGQEVVIFTGGNGVIIEIIQNIDDMDKSSITIKLDDSDELKKLLIKDRNITWDIRE